MKILNKKIFQILLVIIGILAFIKIDAYASDGVTREQYENLLVSATSLLCEDEGVDKNMDNIFTQIEDIPEVAVEAESEESLTDIEIDIQETELTEEVSFKQENNAVEKNDDIANNLTNTESNN